MPGRDVGRIVLHDVARFIWSNCFCFGLKNNDF